ncbi:hypothetical protein, partial [Pedobacter quisquiliarum]|uniref:hypothetical protein n=1 Tax=Pedobacter quisquiliarum TaxID=1834438 RepID=UPI001E5C98DA
MKKHKYGFLPSLSKEKQIACPVFNRIFENDDFNRMLLSMMRLTRLKTSETIRIKGNKHEANKNLYKQEKPVSFHLQAFFKIWHRPTLPR